MDVIRMLNHPIAHGGILAVIFFLGSLVLNREQVADPKLYVITAALGILGALVEAARRRRRRTDSDQGADSSVR